MRNLKPDFMKETINTLFIFMFNFGILVNAQDIQREFDIVIYGGTSAGIAAAIQSSRMGKSVIIIEPSRRIGGLTTGGLGQTDIGNKQAIGGISREFYQNIKKYYQNPDNWQWQEPGQYRDGGQTRTEEGEETMWTFEPSAALKVFKDMIAEEKIELVYGQRLDRSSGVKKIGETITGITMLNGESYKGRIFIDATYEGDLMAASGVSYTYGRESNEQYGESLNGVQPNKISLSLKGEFLIMVLIIILWIGWILTLRKGINQVDYCLSWLKVDLVLKGLQIKRSRLMDLE